MSFIDAATWNDLQKVAEDGLATKLSKPKAERWLVLSRWNPVAEDWSSIAPQRVVVDYADRQERTITTESGRTITIDGWMTAYAPFDVKENDLFSFGMTGDEERGEIILTRPEDLGTQRAAFRLRLGEQ